MRAITVTEAETNFSRILTQVKNGERFKILHDSLEVPLAMLIPAEPGVAARKIGILDGKAGFTVNGTGKISEEEFLGL